MTNYNCGESCFYINKFQTSKLHSKNRECLKPQNTKTTNRQSQLSLLHYPPRKVTYQVAGLCEGTPRLKLEILGADPTVKFLEGNWLTFFCLLTFSTRVPNPKHRKQRECNTHKFCYFDVAQR